MMQLIFMSFLIIDKTLIIWGDWGLILYARPGGLKGLKFSGLQFGVFKLA